MTTGAPPRAAVDKHREALELARRRTALQVDTVAHAVTGLDDTVGWSRLTELGTASTVRAQSGAVTATTELLSATLDAAGVAADLADALPGIEPGRLASGRDVRGMFDRTRDIVQARMAGGAAFPEALDASANVLTAIASSEPHRIARDGQFNVGLSDNRFDKFRRVAVGNTCKFCLTLATRGAVYLTAESAGQSRRYHYKCDCYVELVVDPAAIEASKSTSGDWRNAIREPGRTRMRRNGSQREFADLPDNVVEDLAKSGSREAVAELAARRAFDAVAVAPGVAPDVVVASAPGSLPVGWSESTPHPGRLSVTNGQATVETDLWYFHDVEIGTKFADEFLPEQLSAMQEAAATVARNLDEVMRANPLRGGTPLNVTITRLDGGIGGLTSIPKPGESTITMKISSKLFAEAEQAKWISAAKTGKVQPGMSIDPIRATVSHEYGHAYAISKGGADGHEVVAAMALDPVADRVSFNGFSTYGQSSINETYAEAFAEWAMRSSLGGKVHPVTEALARSEGWP